jgi:hypothetical protein
MAVQVYSSEMTNSFTSTTVFFIYILIAISSNHSYAVIFKSLMYIIDTLIHIYFHYPVIKCKLSQSVAI